MSINKDTKSLNWRHIGFFYLIHVILITFVNWIWKEADQNTPEMMYANIALYIAPPLIILLMILTYKSDVKLNFIQKTLMLMGLIIIGFIWIFILNYFNFFNRIITEQDITNGILRSGIYSIVMFIICLPIIGLVKSKVISKN